MVIYLLALFDISLEKIISLEALMMTEFN